MSAVSSSPLKRNINNWSSLSLGAAGINNSSKISGDKCILAKRVIISKALKSDTMVLVRTQKKGKKGMVKQEVENQED